MTDNTTLNPGVGGNTYADDDIGGVHYQRIKVTLGADGVNDGDVSSSNPMPVSVISGGGGGTQYTEDAAAAADPTGTVPILVRADTPATITSANGDNVAQRGTNYGAAFVQVVDSSGNFINSFGGGTQYTEDAAAAADPVGNALIIIRDDARAGSLTSANGDNVALRGTNSGELYVKHVDSVPITDNAGSITGDVTGTVAHDAVGTAVAPVLAGGYASAAAPTDVSADGDAVRSWYLRNGAQATVLTAAGALIPGDATNGLDVDVIRIGGQAPTFGAGAVAAGTQRVTHASDDPVTTSVQLLDDAIVADNAAFTDGTTKLDMAGYIFDEVAGTALTENDAAAARINTNRAQVFALEDGATRARYATVTASNALKVDGSAVTQPVSLAAGATSIGKAEDSASADADVGVPAMARRTATPANTSGADLDYEMLQMANGRLWTSATIDAAVPAGNNNIGDVDVVGGTVAHDGVGTGINPLLMGGYASAAAPTDVSADGDAVRAWYLRNGAQAAVITAAGALIGGDAANGLDVDVTRVTGTVTTADNQTIVDNAAFTDGTSKVLMAGFVYDEVAGTALTENDAAAGRINVNRAVVNVLEDGVTRGRYATVTAANALKTDGSAVTQPVSLAAGATAIAKAEDSASADLDVGVPAMAVRKATPANTSGTDGDYEMLQMANGRLHTSTTVTDGTTTVSVIAGTAALKSDLSSVAGTATVTAAAGVARVGIAGNANATLDSTVGPGTAPTNALAVAGLYNNTPPAPTAGQALAIQLDQAGNTRGFPGIALTTLSAWTSATSVNATQTIYSNSGTPAVLLHLVQTSTITGGAITFEVSYDNTNWVTIPADCVIDPSATTFSLITLPYTLVASTNKPFLLLNRGWQGLRIKLSTAITGTASVTPNYALLPYNPFARNSLDAIAGTAIAANNGAASAGTLRVTLASDSTGNIATIGTSVTPGTGATNLGKAEDAVHASGDVGVLALAVSNEANTARAADGDYIAIATDTEGNLRTLGNRDHDAVDAGEPVKIGARVVTSPKGLTLPANADRTDAFADADGMLMVKLNTSAADLVSERVSNTDGASTAFTNFSAVASTRNYVTAYSVFRTDAGTTPIYVDFRDGTAGSILWSVVLPPNGGANLASAMPLFKTSANTALAFDVSAATTTVFISVSGYQSKAG